MSFILNKKQQETFDRLKAFVKDPIANTFILNGYAGTGKTLLIQEFAKFLQKSKKKFMLLATTGRAASILRGKTNFATSTIHGALYTFSKVDGDYEELTTESPIDDFGQMKLLFKPNASLSEECVYIVDEASMLASESLDETSFAVFGTGHLLSDFISAVGKNKIIFVGDNCQLPPVGQNFSPALDIDYLNKLGRVTVKASLDEIMRTDKDNDILQIASAVRLAIGQPQTSKWISMPALNRKNCTVVPDKNTLFLEYYACFLQYGSDGSIGIAHSNKACNHLNIFFRKRLFPGRNNLLEIGEILMVNQNNYIVPLTNGDFVKILSLGEKSERMGLRFQNVTLQHLVTKTEYEIKLALDPLGNLSPNLTIDQQRLLMIDFSKRMRSKKIKPNSDFYNDAMQKDAYLNSLRATYGYVVTCHKSQGGEWKKVFLFLDKGMYGYLKPDEMRKWWYTAITRTKQQLYLHKEWWIK